MNTLFIKLCLKCTFYTNQPKKDVCEHGYVYYAVFIYESGTQAATHTQPYTMDDGQCSDNLLTPI